LRKKERAATIPEKENQVPKRGKSTKRKGTNLLREEKVPTVLKGKRILLGESETFQRKVFLNIWEEKDCGKKRSFP